MLETTGPDRPGYDRPAPGVRRLRAPNPSPMTEAGTNSYILGEGEVAIVDPGPAIADHAQAILSALAPGERVVAIIVTHRHADHAALARPLAEACGGAAVLAFDPAEAAVARLPRTLAGIDIGGGEGLEPGFRADAHLADGAGLPLGGGELVAIHTPGHLDDHLCLRWGDAILSGDHVMGWAPSLVSPPDGDMGAYMRSLGRLEREGAAMLLPGHGDPVGDPATRIAGLRAHRLGREAAVRAALAEGPKTLAAITFSVYGAMPPGLAAAAERNALAHLIDLERRGEVVISLTNGARARHSLRFQLL